ncbi:MAG TPA: ABC transporter ATP-binding protein [Trueperaceae bacterium]|nr:ABC transporter ATP-binding protein [Trueperaceae bacterium]
MRDFDGTVVEVIMREMAAPLVRITELTKRYSPASHAAVDKLDLNVNLGEVLCLLGPSGCGKTTLLRLIAGFERPDGGEIDVAGKVVASPRRWVEPEHRRIGFVFQDFALFPHLDVLDNVAFGLTGTKAARRARAAEILALVGLTVFQERFPHQLSGGQQQRVALARALAPQPHILLLDEPFSNLDASLRGATRDEVRNILGASGTTAVMVTHDQEEALSFGDRVAVMRDGKVEQTGAPEAVYFSPATAFVASFLGRTNLLRGVANGKTAHTSIGEVPLTAHADGRVVISLRPDHVTLRPLATAPGQGGHDEATTSAAVPAAGATLVARARVTRREFKGHAVTLECSLTSSVGANSAAAAVGGEGGVQGHEERLIVFGAPGNSLNPGDEADVLITGEGVTLKHPS